MGVRLVTEVLDHAPASWNQSERLIVLAIAEKANDETRRCYPGARLIAHRAGMDVGSLSRTLRRLAKKGTEMRVPVGTDRTGRTVYAHRSHQTVFEIPRLCPLAVHSTRACVQWPDDGPPISSESGSESPDDGPAIDVESPDQGPPISAERPDGGPPIENPTPDGGPAINRERADHRPLKGGPPSAPDPQDPQRSDPQLPSAETTPNPAPTNGRPAGRQPTLFPKTVAKPPEAVRVILDALHNADHPEACADDAKAIHRALVAQYGTKVGLGYLRGIAAKGGFDGYYADVRRERAEQAEAQIRQLQASEPECEHGAAAGRSPHPVNGEPLCPQCRTGRPPVDETGPRTHPDVVAALDAYRAAHDGPLHTTQLVALTQHAVALYARGASADQLAQVATLAGRLNVDLLTAATKTGAPT